MQLNRKGATNGIPLWLLGLTIFLVISRVALLTGHFSQVSVNYMSWQAPAALASETGKQTKPILLFFAGEHSPKSKLMESSVFSNKLVAAYVESNYYPVKIEGDVHRNPELSKIIAELYRRYLVVQIPTLVVTTPRGSEVSHLNGYKPAAQIYQFLSTVREGIHLREVEESEKLPAKKELSPPLLHQDSPGPF
jgi:thioredoxin-related protein